MNIPYTDSLFLGIFRILLWVLFLYILKRLIFKGERSRNQVKAMGNLWAFYGSIVLVLIFILVQINSYDLFTCLLLLLLFFCFRLVGFNRLAFNWRMWERRRKSVLIRVIENVEDKDSIVEVSEGSNKERFGVKPGFYIAVGVCVIAVTVRFYLMQFDSFQLSVSWFEELSLINDISNQSWFNNQLTLAGEAAFMNFYALITGISKEMALESFGLFQAFLLCFVIFWFVDAMTNSLVTIPLIAALAFALFFNLAPINIPQISHNKSTFMAFTFFLPAMIFIRKPWKLYQAQPKAYFFGMLMLFLAIGLIDFFTYFFLLVPYFVLAAVFLRKKYRKYFWQAISAYAISIAVIMGYYLLACYRNDVDFWMFFRSNLLSVSATTTTDNLLFSYSYLILSFQVISLISVVVMTVLFSKKSVKWASPLMFIIYVNGLILLSRLDLGFFDIDLFNEVLPIFIACSIGLAFYIIYYFFNTGVRHIEIPDKLSAPLLFMGFIAGAFYSQQTLFTRVNQNDNILSKDILEAYQKIHDGFIPYGFAVINANTMQPISRGSHNFISYEDFVENYPQRDSVYFANKEDKEFLRQNTEYIIPNSLLVFVYDSVPSEFAGKVPIDESLLQRVDGQLKAFESNGRTVRLFFEKGDLKVYEIVNNPSQAKLSELL
ncbi:hypothetical protein [Roseivirga pacifica]